MSKVLEWINRNREKDGAAVVYRTAGTDTYQSITYNELYDYIISVSGYLSEYKNKTIAIIGNNKLEYLVSLLAILCNIGSVFVVDKEFKKGELVKLFNEMRPDILIVDDEISIEYEETDIVKFSRIHEIMKANYEFEAEQSFAGDLILHTSGTTGNPKCIRLTEEMYLYIIKDLNVSWKVMNKHSCLFIIPLYHIYALTSLFHGIYAGITNILEWDYSRLEDVLKKTNPSIFLGVPLIFNKIKDKAYEKGGAKLKFGIGLSKVLLLFKIDIRKKLFKEIHNYFGNNYYFAVSGGSMANPDTNKFFDDIGLPLYSGYGMTETSGPIAISYEKNNRYDSVGRILNNDIMIMDEGQDGIGEICVSGKNTIKKYVNEEKNDCFNGDYFRTGDLGYVKDGFLYITGRKKEILIGDNGKNVSAIELSKRIMENKEIYDCVIKMEDNKIVAILDTGLSEDKLNAYISQVNSNLPDYKKISEFRIISKGLRDGNR